MYTIEHENQCSSKVNAMNIKQKIEKFFEQWAYSLFGHPKKVLFTMFVIIGLFISQLSSLTIDTSVEALLHKNDPQRMKYDRFREMFGREEFIVIAIRSDHIFSESFFKQLKHLHKTLENEVPYLKSVTSLVNARDVYGEKDTVHVEKLLNTWPENGMTIDDLKRKIQSNPALVNNLISEDGTYTTIIVETVVYKDENGKVNVREKTETGMSESDLADFDSENVADTEKNRGEYLSVEDNHTIVTAIQGIMDTFRAPDFDMYLAGAPVVSDTFNEATIRDAGLTSILALFAITFFLAILFRRISGVFIAWTVVLSALFCVYGLMAMCQVPITLTTTIIPSFLLAVGVGDSVHILTIFYRKFNEGCTKADAVAYSMKHSGLAVVMTSLTTAAGLLSFSIADLSAIADVGIYTAAGVILALVFTLVMIPPFLAILPIKQGNISPGRENTPISDRLLLSVADFANNHAAKIVIVCLLLLALSVAYTLKINFSHDMITWFPDSMDIKNDIKVIDKEFKGSVSLEVVLDTGKTNGLYSYRLLNRIDQATTDIKKITSGGVTAGNVASINDIVKEINKALYNNDETYYSIPQDDKKIAENLFLFECGNSDDLEKITDSKMRMTRITIKTPSVDAVAYKKYIAEVSTILNRVFPEDVHVEITGMTSLLSRTITATLTSMTESYFIAFAVITIMMIFLIGDVKLGLASMFPNLLPIIMATGFMGYVAIPLDMCTIMVGSIAIGLVVDDTLHFMYNFQRSCNRTGNSQASVRETLMGTGRAMLFTSMILSAGFYAVMFASLRHTVRFGFLLGSIIILALAADFILAPAIVILMTPNKRSDV